MYKARVEIPQKDLRRKYCKQKLSATAIGKQYGCSNVTVRDWLRRYGIKRRTQKEALKLINANKAFRKRWDNPALPEIGEVRCKDNDTGNGKNYYIWAPCINCKQLRWTIYRKSAGILLRCQRCASLKGARSHLWKGGRSITRQGYIEVRLYESDPYYSMSKADGYLKEHRLIMARHLGRCLTPYEIVHHKNGKRDDNRIENLELQSRKGHTKGYRYGYIEGYRQCTLDLGQKIDDLNSEIRLLQWHTLELEKSTSANKD